jgi:YspA, cpYpsA-related SLOG family
VRLSICGGRNLDEMKAMGVILEWISNYPSGTVKHIIQGGARGADRAARTVADALSIPQTQYDADWEKYGKSAGPIRNRIMLTEGKPDVILALTGGRGTANMIEIGREAGIPVFELEYN